MSEVPASPQTRIETYLAGALGQQVVLPEPVTRLEQYLKAIAESGGGGGGLMPVIIYAESHTTVETYVVPVLTDAQITAAYNGIVAGKVVVVVDDLDTIAMQVFDASSIDGTAIRLIFTDKMILNYKEGGEIEATPFAGGTAPVSSVNGKTGIVVLNAGDILAQNSQTIQANLDRIDETAEQTIDDLEVVEAIAKGAQQAITYSDYEAFITAFNALDGTEYNEGQNVMIIALEVPDLWVSYVEETSVPYTYVDDDTFIAAMEDDGYVQVGYYKISMLETQKVDLTDYATKTYVGEELTDNSNAFAGATSLTAGTAGLVPAPTTADSEKFLKGDGTWGAAGGDGIKTLTTADYNWPTNNPTSVALWLLDYGIYIAESEDVALKSDASDQISNLWLYRVFIVAPRSTGLKTIIAFSINAYSSSSAGITWSVNSYGSVTGPEDSYILNAHSVVDNLSSSSQWRVLSANQGRVIKDLIDSLIVKGTGAPTTATVGTVGQLYEDTTNGKLYQCTDVTGGTYTWEEIGAGGGGGDIVYSDKQTSNSSNGGAVYIGAKNAQQEIVGDPSTTDNHYKYFWAIPTSITYVPGDRTIGILGNPSFGATHAIAMGTSSAGTSSICIGYDAAASTNNAIAIGATHPSSPFNGSTRADYPGSIALGSGANPRAAGIMDIGLSGFSDPAAAAHYLGYNQTTYRIISGVHDGEQAHDAMTVGQANALIDAINSALSTSIPHIGA